jgi:hypothetical protein
MQGQHWACAFLCRKPLNRRFIVVEGIYAHTGDLAPLAEIFKLKEQYKCAPPADAHELPLEPAPWEVASNLLSMPHAACPSSRLELSTSAVQAVERSPSMQAQALSNLGRLIMGQSWQVSNEPTIMRCRYRLVVDSSYALGCESLTAGPRPCHERAYLGA